MSGIDPSIEAFAALRVALGIRKKDDFAVKPPDRLSRNAVGEMIGDLLHGAGRIKVRQVAAAVPSGIAPWIAIRLNGAFFFGVPGAVGVPKRRRAGQATGAPGRSGSSGLDGGSQKQKARTQESGRTFLHWLFYSSSASLVKEKV